MTHQDNRMRNVAGSVLKYGLLAAILIWFFSSGRIRFDYFTPAEQFAWPLLCGATMLLTSMLCLGLRFRFALRAVGIPCTFPTAIKAGFTGLFFTYCTMGTLSGDVMRWVYATRAYPGTGEKVTAALVGDRLVGIMSLIGVCGFALYLGMGLQMPDNLRAILGAALLLFLLGMSSVVFLLGYQAWRWFGVAGAGVLLASLATYMGSGLAQNISFPIEVNFVVLATGCVCLGFLLAMIASRLSLEKLAHSNISPGTFAGKIFGMGQALLAFKDSPKTLSTLLVLTISQHMSAIFGIYFLSRVLSLPAAPSLEQVFFAAPLTFMLNAIPLPGSGVGVHEASFDALLAVSAPALGIATLGGANIYLLFRVGMTCLSFIGIPCYIGMKKAETPSENHVR